MAHVHGIGARVYLHPDPEAPNPLPDGSVSFGVQTFATLEAGNIVMAREPNGLTTEQVPESVDELREMILIGLHQSEPEARANIFGSLVTELARLDIHTDLETLMHLPFHVEVTSEVAELLEG